MDAKVDLGSLKCVGEASCLGGKHPDPPLDKYPLLAWSVNHPRHGSKVFTEDGKASVEDLALSAAESPNVEAVAAKFGTTPDHAAQAVDYAIKAGFLGAAK
jgi:hypothetical protein